jgi:hypothetical protein
MYATSTLLVVCGIPATTFLTFMVLLKTPAYLNRHDVLLGGLFMLITVMLIAIVLHWLARTLEKRLQKI